MYLFKKYENFLNENKYLTFDDLVFKVHEYEPNGKHAKITFDNGYGVSVVFGKLFYSNGIDTYEMMCVGSNGENIYSDVCHYMSKDEISKEMIRLQKRKEKKRIFSSEDPYGEEEWEIENESKSNIDIVYMKDLYEKYGAVECPDCSKGTKQICYKCKGIQLINYDLDKILSEIKELVYGKKILVQSYVPSTNTYIDLSESDLKKWTVITEIRIGHIGGIDANKYPVYIEFHEIQIYPTDRILIREPGKQIFSEIDPYGEEEWDDDILENYLTIK